MMLMMTEANKKICSYVTIWHPPSHCWEGQEVPLRSEERNRLPYIVAPCLIAEARPS